MLEEGEQGVAETLRKRDPPDGPCVKKFRSNVNVRALLQVMLHHERVADGVDKGKIGSAVDEIPVNVDKEQAAVGSGAQVVRAIDGAVLVRDDGVRNVKVLWLLLLLLRVLLLRVLLLLLLLSLWLRKEARVKERGWIRDKSPHLLALIVRKGRVADSAEGRVEVGHDALDLGLAGGPLQTQCVDEPFLAFENSVLVSAETLAAD